MSTFPTTSRRNFLKGAALAAPILIPGRVLGAESATPPSDTVTLGMIGVGRQCYLKNIPLFKRQKDCRIVAACDVDSWRLAEGAKKIGGDCKLYDDYNELLARKDIDAVVISTPDHWHSAMALDAFAAGKDVALEKPIIRSIPQGQAIVNSCKKHARVFRVDSEFRVGAPARRAYSVVQSGVLGKIHTVTACVPQSDIGCAPQAKMDVPPELDFTRWLGTAKTGAPPIDYTLFGVHPRKDWGRPGWMRKLNFCDGMVTNWGTHLLNGSLWCLGLDRQWPTEISGTGEYPQAESFWNVLLKFNITYKYAGGTTINYRTESPRMRFKGEKGWIDAGFRHFKASDEKFTKMQFPLVDSPTPAQASEKRDFLDAVKTRRPSAEPAEVGHCVTSTCLLGNIAINAQEKLQWDGEKQQFIGNEKANKMLATPITTPNPALQAKKN